MIKALRVPWHEALIENCRMHPARPFIKSHAAVYTYDDIRRLSNGLAAYMRAQGLGRGARVCLVMPRTPEMVISLIGASQIGVYAAPVNYTVSPHEVLEAVRVGGPSLIIIDGRHAGAFDLGGYVRETGVRVLVTGTDGPEGYHRWDEAVLPLDEDIHEAIAMDDVSYLNYTTGSSGTPRGALATHDNVYFNTLGSCEAMGITGEDVHLCMFASFAHPHELFARPLYTGGSLVLLEEINPRTISRTIREHGVTCMMGLAPMYEMMTRHCADMEFPTLRIAESGGMYTMPDLNGRFMEAFGIPVLSVWGSTETSGIAIANTPNAYKTDGSAGRACPCYEVMIVDEAGGEAPRGEEGEIAFRGPGVIAGYLNGEPFDMRDGWYMSGDMGRMYEDGFVYFMERKSGMIKVAGLKVYPLQVELELLEHPGIAEAAVIGIVDRLRGNVPMAFVVLRPGFEDMDEGDVKRFCRGRMGDYMIPRKIRFIEALPRIGSGKINKKVLKEDMP